MKGYFAVVGTDGLFWAGGDCWCEDWAEARLFPAGPGDPYGQAASAANHLREHGRPCTIGYLERPAAQVVAR